MRPSRGTSVSRRSEPSPGHPVILWWLTDDLALSDEVKTPLDDELTGQADVEAHPDADVDTFGLWDGSLPDFGLDSRRWLCWSWHWSGKG